MELHGHDSGSDGSIFIYLGMAVKSDSGVMFCLQSYQDLESIDPADRINTQVIYRTALAQVECTS